MFGNAVTDGVPMERKRGSLKETSGNGRGVEVRGGLS
jgi:hypothetical protein